MTSLTRVGGSSRILVREVMNSPVVTCSPDDSVKSAASKMARFKVGSAVVMKGKEPVGIVTDGDVVLKTVAEDRLPASVKVREIMSRTLYTIDSESEIADAARMLRSQGIKRLGVTYKNRLVGIVSISDLMAITPQLMDVLSEKSRVAAGVSRRSGGYLSGYCDSCKKWSDYLLESDGTFLCEECSKTRPG